MSSTVKVRNVIDAALLKQAMLGTDKSGGGSLSVQDSSDDALTTLTESIATGEASWNVLLKAGCWAVAEKAGFQPQTIAMDSSSDISSAVETRKEIPGPLTEILETIIKKNLDSSYVSLFFLKRLVDAGLRLPFESLPRFLHLFSQRTYFQEHGNILGPLLGERGRWICTQNPEWKNLNFGRSFSETKNDTPTVGASMFEEIWNEGTFREREAALLHYRQGNRQSDPLDAAKSAREMLSQTWKSEKAEHREAFLQTFQYSLNETDVPFLEDALKDRSKGVRQIAAKLLAQIDKSDFAKRSCARAEEILADPQSSANNTSVKTKGFVEAITERLRGKKRLEIFPPKTYTKEMKADAIDEKPPQGTGQQAWWLSEIVSRVPPSHWEVFTGLTPNDFLTALEKDDFFVPFLRGVTLAALLFEKSPSHSESVQKCWFEPIWDAWGRQKQNAIDTELYPQLMQRCMLFDLLYYWDKICFSGNKFLISMQYSLDMAWIQVLAAQPVPWSQEFGTALLEFLETTRARNSHSSLFPAVAIVPEELLDRAESLTQINKAVSQTYPVQSYTTRQIELSLELRKEFDRLLNEMQR